MDAQAFLRELTTDRRYRGQIVHVRELPPREPVYAEPASPLPELLAGVLRRQNIHRLYSHQAYAYDAVRAGRDCAIVTGTASGKTLCYNLPVAATLLEDPDARALYLFPAKALAQDQLGTLQRWAGADPALAKVLAPAVYDGDTPAHNRAKIRSAASVVLSNPDMLHVGVLPYHTKWHHFLSRLRFIVLDEVHTYRGIFGSHVANVLRRLLRMCEHYGGGPQARRGELGVPGRPQIICCSATVANPLELTGRLTGRKLELIDNDGSPRGRKYFALWNPPFIDAPGEQVQRRSANIEAVYLLTELVRRRAQTIVFTKARIVAELIYKYARDQLAGEGDLAQRIRPYRGGYLPSERREIEQELFSGRLLAVASTNALELGIDVGSLDAAILVGFPGTVCSTWQQAGRAGRSASDSLIILLGYNDPVDQYMMRHPEYFFSSSHEHAIIDPGNPYILSAQLSCACFEKPLTEADAAWFGPMTSRVARIIADDGHAKDIDGRFYWSCAENPAQQTNLRTISQSSYAIVDSGTGKTIGQCDSISAPELVYPQAVYLHEGESYIVRRLDEQAHIAYVEACAVDYYTQPVLANHCRIVAPREQRAYRGGRSVLGDVEVTWQTTAFRKVKYYTMELIGQDSLDLPAQTLATSATWWTVSEQMRDELSAAGHSPVEALVGVRNLMLAALPGIAMCDRRDISGQVDSSNLGEPTIFVYDRYPGGVGFAQKGFELMDEWLDICRAIVSECPCEAGCPSCVGLPNLRPPIHHDPDLGGGYPVPDKAAAMLLLELLVIA